LALGFAFRFRSFLFSLHALQSKEQFFFRSFRLTADCSGRKQDHAATEDSRNSTKSRTARYLYELKISADDNRGFSALICGKNRASNKYCVGEFFAFLLTTQAV